MFIPFSKKVLRTFPKYQRDISGNEEKVISLYTRRMSTRDIHDQLKDLYGIELSAEMVSKITDRILPQVRERQSRRPSPIYPFVFMNCYLIRCSSSGTPMINTLDIPPLIP